MEEDVAETPSAPTSNTATTESGETLSYNGELGIGTAVTIEVDGVSIPAPEGVHVLTGEMAGVSIVIDIDGIVTDIVKAEEEAPAVEEAPAETVAPAVEELAKQTAKKLFSLAKSNKALAKRNEILSTQNAVLKSTFESQIKGLTERVLKIERTPVSQPKKKHNRTEQTHTALSQNSIVNGL